jgi:hypothetical protein
MRAFFAVLLIAGIAFGQAPDTAKPADTAPQTSAAAPASGTAASGTAHAEASGQNPVAPPQLAPQKSAQDPNAAVIPAGAKIPLTLKQAISTKNAREGDPVYAETVFPFVVNERILIPAGTYIQGKIMHTERAGRGQGRSEILIHFTSMIYPSGYTVMLPGSIDNTPGADDKSVKDSEGTIQADKDTGKRVEDAAKGAAVGGTIGGIGGAAAGGWSGARYGGLAGLVAGAAWGLLKHGPDVKLEVGTSIEMEIQRPVSIDASRIQLARAGS